MSTTKTAPKSNTTRKRKPSLADREAAQKAAGDSAERVKKMSDAERRKLIAEYDKGKARRRYLLATSAPTAESAGSDLLPVLQAIGLEFFRRYYPDATRASFHASRDSDKGPPEYHVMLPIPCEIRQEQESTSVSTAESTDKEKADVIPRPDLLGKDIEHAVALWIAQSRSAMDQIVSTAAAMVARIKSDPDCVLAGMFADTDIEKLDHFEGALSDASTMLNDVYPLIGKLLVDPIAAMDEE
jgi:hypothetical protein